MIRSLFAFLVVFVISVVAAAPAAAQKKPITPTKQWSGSVEDEKAKPPASPIITNAKDFEKVWKELKVKGEMPMVDFAKEVVVLTTTSGSKLNLIAVLDEKGDLQVLGKATLDFGPGFRYVIATVSREGIKTVNGKELPK
jgi:hypothetical protein